MDLHVINNNGGLTVIHVTSVGSVPIGTPSKSNRLDDTYVRNTYYGANAIDFVMKMYEDRHLPFDVERNMHTFSSFLPFKYRLVDPLGIPPHKTRPSDSGFDLHLISIKKTFGKVTLYGTGVSVEPPAGYYFDMVPRSSMIKTGYMLANSVGIIDQGYTGEIMVPLIKMDPDAPDLELPCKMVQLIPRKWHGFSPVNNDDVIQTERGSGGFGSTGK